MQDNYSSYRETGRDVTSVGGILPADACPSVQLLAVLLSLPGLVPDTKTLHAPAASRR